MRKTSAVACLLLAALAVPCRVKAAFHCSTLVAGTENLDAGSLVSVYERILNGPGAGVLSEADLRRLRQGNPFLLDPDGRAEAVAVAEGLASLGALVASDPYRWTGVREGIRMVLDRRLAGTGDNRSRREDAVRISREVRPFSRLISTGDPSFVSAAFSGDGSRVAVLAQFPGTGQARVFDLRSGNLLQSFDLEDEVSEGTLNEDGSILVSFHDKEVRIWNVGTGTAQGRSNPLKNAQSVANGFVDGGAVVLVAAGTALIALRVADGKVRNLFETNAHVGEALASPAGNSVVVSSILQGGMNKLFILDGTLWGSGLPMSLKPVDSWVETKVYRLAWAPGGDRWVVSTSDALNHVAVRGPLSERILLERSVPARVDSLGVSQSGRLIVTLDAGKILSVIDAEEETRTQLGRHGGSWGKVGVIGESHAWVVWNRLDIWDIANRRQVFESIADGGRFLHYDPKRKLLYESVNEFTGVRIWNLAEILEERQ